MKTRRIELTNVFEADVLDGILNEEGIPHAVISNESSAYDGLFQLRQGWGFMEVPEEFLEKALKLFQDFKQSLNVSQGAGMSDAGGVIMETGPASGGSETESGRLECGWPHNMDADGPAKMEPAPGHGTSQIEEVFAMFDQNLIQSVMDQTGADRETASAALRTSDGNVDIAVRIIRSYTLRDDAGTSGGYGAESAHGSDETGTGGDYGSESQGAYGYGSGTGDTTEGTGTTGSQGTGGTTGQSEGKKGGYAYNIPKAQDIIDSIKEIWKRGNASRLDIEKDGRVILSLPLTVSTIGLAIAPVAALIGLGAALVTQFTIKVTLDNGTVINVNEFAVTHRHSTENRGPKDPE